MEIVQPHPKKESFCSLVLAIHLGGDEKIKRNRKEELAYDDGQIDMEQKKNGNGKHSSPKVGTHLRSPT